MAEVINFVKRKKEMRAQLERVRLLSCIKETSFLEDTPSIEAVLTEEDLKKIQDFLVGDEHMVAFQE